MLQQRESPRLRKKEKKKLHSPEHVGCAKHHIKLATIETRRFLGHFCRFQQPRLFQQKLTWWGERERERCWNADGSSRRHWGIHAPQVLNLALLEGQSALSPEIKLWNRRYEQHQSILWPALRPISHISQLCYICLFSIKMFLVGGFMSYFGSRLRWQSFCIDLENEMWLRAVHGDWNPSVID